MSNIYDAPREILEKIPFVELIEMENNKKDASCCGVAAYISCNEYTKILQRQRIKEAIDTGAEYLIVTCPKCLAHFNCYLNEHSELKKKLKVIDLTSFIGTMLWLI
jgi:Fe-S oxidoreductase